GGRCGMIAPDTMTFAYLKGRPYAPKGNAFERAVEAWSALASDPNATFDREVALDADSIAPIVTWGTTPDDALPIEAMRPIRHAKKIRCAPNICVTRSTTWQSRLARS